MQLNLIENPDDTQKVSYKLARIVYAETLAQSLYVVESLASMIYNIHQKFNKSFDDIANDKNIFESPRPWGSPGKNIGVGCHALFQGNLPNLGIEPASLTSPALAGKVFTTSATN